MSSLSTVGPLAGIRVIELSGIGPGPFAATLLGDMGADVVRVDRPGWQASMIPAESHPLRRSRRAVTLDLREPSGRESLLELIEHADVLIEGYRPGVMERLRLGPAECAQANPRLIFGRMTGWGQDGPLASVAGHDINYLALSGALHAIGREGGPPVIPVNILGDFGGGSTYLVMGVLAALHERSRSGLGQVVDAAIVDGVASLSTMLHALHSSGHWEDRRGVNMLDSGAPWYDVYETADGGHIAVGAIEPEFFGNLMSTLQLDYDVRTQYDRANWPHLRTRLSGAFAAETRNYWEVAFADIDACVTPVLSLSEAVNHPHALARDSFVEVAGIVQPVPAPRFERTPTRVYSAPAGIGGSVSDLISEWGSADAKDPVSTTPERMAE